MTSDCQRIREVPPLPRARGSCDRHCRTSLKDPAEAVLGGASPEITVLLDFLPCLCFPPSHTSLTCDHVLNKLPISESSSQVLHPEHLSRRPLRSLRGISSFLWLVFSQHLYRYNGAHPSMAVGDPGNCLLGPAAIFLFCVSVYFRKVQLASQCLTYRGLCCLGNVEPGDRGAQVEARCCLGIHF